MERTDWTKMVSERALSTEKSLRKKIFVSMKIAASDLPAMIDQGWEKSKEYKSPKFVGITKEKPANEQFEDLVWLLFANMGFSEMNAGSPFEVSYDFHDGTPC